MKKASDHDLCLCGYIEDALFIARKGLVIIAGLFLMGSLQDAGLASALKAGFSGLRGSRWN